jgi:hypothetical protein
MKKLINLTPHPIVIINGGGTVTLPPSGMVARVSEREREVSRINNIPIVKIEYGDVNGLPEPETGTIYIVSALVAQVVVNRVDIVYPTRFVRDEAGRIIGCGALAATSWGGENNGHNT